ncbi:MAG TPA: multiprotein bridging factor aMBF1 [Methanocorpusculum sp.]|nr:multiprotein bridging factor aMBF1 [Methanocorpusculum sp.]
MKTEYCELCGAPISKNYHLVQIEGAKPMKVCDSCAKLGTEIKKPQPSIPTQKRIFVPPLATNTTIPPTPNYHKRDIFEELDEMIIEDFGKRIAKARQSRGLTQKELALILKMQEIDIKKLERCDREPTDIERKKLEKELNIVLTDTTN